VLDYTDEMFKKSEYEDIHKPKLVKTIEQLITLAQKSRREGLLSLEEIFDEEKDEFRKMIGMFVVDGIDYDVRFIFGMNIIRTTKIIGFELRDMMLWNKGMAMIAEGHHPWIITHILYSMIGELKYDGGFFEATREKLI